MLTRILELFGGIGACTKALKRLKKDIEVVDYVEIDKYAVKSYNAINGTNFEPQDITKWDKDVEVDLVMHGSPCQDFSIAGKQAGGNEDSGTRSSLMYETIRIVEKLRPKYVVWENVKNLLSAKHRHNFDNYIEAMKKLGYTSYYQVLNAKDYGIPQNRERIFTISILGEHKPFVFPEKQPLELRLKDLLEDEVEEKYYLSNEKTKMIQSQLANKETLLIDLCQSKREGKPREYNEIAPTLSARDYKEPRCVQVGTLDIKGMDCIKRVYSDEGLSPTLTNMQGGNRQPKVEVSSRIRKLTPKECWRLMGYNDEDFDKAAKVNSSSQLYKQAGNSICVPVLEAIFKNLF